MVHLKSGFLGIFSRRWVTLMNFPDQTANGIEIIFSQIFYMVYDYNNPEFELNPLTLSVIHGVIPHGTENKKLPSPPILTKVILNNA